MIHHSLGPFIPPSPDATSSEDETGDEAPPNHEAQQPTPPRMVQPTQDDMDVDQPARDETRREERTQRPKRGRDHDDRDQTPHSVPKLKRQRTSPNTSPERSDHQQIASSSSSSSSSCSSTSSISPSASGTSVSTIRLIRKTLTEKDLHDLGEVPVTELKKAAICLFGESVSEWPEGYSLIWVGSFPPAMEQLFNECGVCILKKSNEGFSRHTACLITPESDRLRLGSGLLQLQFEWPVTQPTADDSDDSEANEEFQQFPIGTHCTPLMFAAALGDTDLMRIILSLGADPNKRDAYGLTALMIAAAHNQIGAVQVLIRDHRTRVNLTDVGNSYALVYAAMHGNQEMFSLLRVFGGATISQLTEPHPLFEAAVRGFYPICELIFSTGVDVDFHIGNRRTALWHAVNGGQIECCRQLLRAGADLKSPTGWMLRRRFDSILHLAVESGNLQLFNVLIEHDKSLNLKQHYANLIYWAVCHEHLHMIKPLVELGLDINHIDGQLGTTLIINACANRSMSVAVTLLEAGADPNIPDIHGRNALVHAAEWGNVEILDLLIKHGAELTSKWHSGYIALFTATARGHLDAMKFLLMAGAPTGTPGFVLKTRNDNMSLLMLVMNDDVFPDVKRQSDALQLLLEHGGEALLHQVNVVGNDALMYAVIHGQPIHVHQLLQAGATVGQVNTLERNALNIAISFSETALSQSGVMEDYDEARLWNFQLILAQAKCQTNWSLLRENATNYCSHPIIRELLCQHASLMFQPGFFAPVAINYDAVLKTVRHLVQNFTTDWDRRGFELALARSGVPVPAIDFYCACIPALSAIRVKLFGLTPTPEMLDAYFLQFFHGVTATMETLLVDKHIIDDAYEALAWNSLRDTLARFARAKIAELTSKSVNGEQQLANVFAGLFDDCLSSTLESQTLSGLPLHTPPAPGILATNLMRRGIYAALAEGIENAWRAAWFDTVNTPKEISSLPASSSNTFSSSSSASSSEFSSSTISSSPLVSEPDISGHHTDSQLNEQQAAQLLSAFKQHLATTVDSASLLILPGASPQDAGWYADLMYRQLHLVAQFIRPQPEIEDRPASLAIAAPMPRAANVGGNVGATAAAPAAAAPGAAASAPEPNNIIWPEFTDLAMFEEVSDPDDWF